jgi:hypothetical protein
MQLRIQAVRLDVPAELRLAIDRRVRLTLGRHAAGIDRVQLTLASDEGATASLCRIRARLRDGESLAVEDCAEGPKSAATAAAWRLSHRMQRRHAATAAHRREAALQRRIS